MSSTIQRRRLSGGGQRGPLLIGLLGTVLFGFLVWIASTDTPAPIPSTPIAEPTPNRPVEQAIFLLQIHSDGMGLAAYDTANNFLHYYGPAFHFTVNRDGTSAFLISNKSLRNVDLLTGTTPWDANLEAGQMLNTLGMALAPDETLLVVVYATQTVDLQNNWVITWYDATTGAHLESQTIPQPFGLKAVYLAADGRHLYLLGQKELAVFDRSTKSITELISSAVPIQATMNESGTKLFVVMRYRLLVIEAVSASIPTEIALQIDATRQPLGNTIAVDPREERIALLYGPAVPENVPVRQGVADLSDITIDIAQFSLKDGGLIQPMESVDSASAIEAYALAYGADTQSLFASIGDQAVLIQGSQVVKQSAATPSIGRVLVRPRHKYAISDATQQELDRSMQQDMLWTFDTQPITPLMQPDSTPFVWIRTYDVNSGNGLVVGIAPDGSQTPIASNVIASIPRPEQPPLLVQDGEHFNTHALYDPSTAQTIPLTFQLDVELQNTIYGSFEQHYFAELSPDGRQVAVIALEKSEKALWIVDLETGTARKITDTQQWQQLKTLKIVGWSDHGIDFLAPGANNGLELRTGVNFHIKTVNTFVALWRIAPLAGSAPVRLWQSTAEATAIYNARSQQLLYQPLATDAARGELHLFDVKTNDDRVIYTGRYLQTEFLSLSPDGTWAVYAQPNDALAQSMILIAYHTEKGSTKQLDSAMEWQHPYLVWLDNQTLAIDGYDENLALFDYAEYHLDSDMYPHKPATTLAPIDAPGAIGKPYRVGLLMKAYTHPMLARIMRDTGRVDVVVPAGDVMTMFLYGHTSDAIVYYP